MKYLSILLLTTLMIGCGNSQTKNEFEKNGVKVSFTTTKMYELNGNQAKLIKDMNLSGTLIFIPEKVSIVIRHDDGNDELLKVNNAKKTDDGNYILDCNKKRTLVLNLSEGLVIYSVENIPSFFALPITKNEVYKIKNVIKQFNILPDHQIETQNQIIENPFFERRDVSYLDIVKIVRSHIHTTIYFKYTAPNTYENGGWVCIKKTFFIRDNYTKKRYRLIKTNSIPLCPKKHIFNSAGETLEFSLVFNAIPTNTYNIDVIEDETTNDDFNFYSVSLK